MLHYGLQYSPTIWPYASGLFASASIELCLLIFAVLSGCSQLVCVLRLHILPWSSCNRTEHVLNAVFQAAEEVNFAANGITAAGLKAFDCVLQSNMFLKTLDLSVNPIGDEGAKVSIMA